MDRSRETDVDNIFVDADTGRVYDLPSMHHIVFEEPPMNNPMYGAGAFHPLCCYVRSQFFQNGTSKTELYEELRSMDDVDTVRVNASEAMRKYRYALRKLCFLLCKVPHPTPAQLDLDVVVNFSDETYKLAVRNLLVTGGVSFCRHWAYHTEKQNRAFQALKAQETTDQIITLD